MLDVSIIGVRMAINGSHSSAYTARLVLRFLLPQAQWRLATVDGVLVVYSTADEIVHAAKAELLKIDDEDGPLGG